LRLSSNGASRSFKVNEDGETMSDRFPIGASATHEWPITHALTVQAHGTVDAAVLATPQLIFMLEDTCLLAVKPFLTNEEISVGTSVHVDHLAAAKVGETVKVTAELVSARGKRLVFRVEGRCGRLIVGRGLHERAVVSKTEFLAACA
jgi:fluoroacetyl-CoA thioesterase